MAIFSTNKDLGDIRLPEMPQIIKNNPPLKYAYYLLLAVFSFILMVFIFVRPFIGKTAEEMQQNINNWFSKTVNPVKTLFDSQMVNAYIDTNGAVHTYMMDSDMRTNILDEIRL